MKNVGILIILTVIAVSASGCGSSAQQTMESEPVCMSANTEVGMDAAQKVITGMFFQIEKFDVDQGYIRTWPLSGAQFFELWRQDNASASSFAEANLHSLRRTVEIEFTRDGSQVCMNCMVYVQRLSVPEQPIQGKTRLSGIYTQSDRSHQSLQLDSSEMSVEWIDLGRDAELEQRIMNKTAKAVLKEISK